MKSPEALHSQACRQYRLHSLAALTFILLHTLDHIADANVGVWLRASNIRLQLLESATMAAYISNGTSIPESQFSCPSNASGIDFVTIPWSNMSTGVFGDCVSETDPNCNGYCGIKGSHPRMAYCCQRGLFSKDIIYNDAPIALAEADHCSQYCSWGFAFIDLWLYCLTEEGDTATNAFCHAGTGKALGTSGSAPRDGPFDSHDELIETYKDYINTSSGGKKASVSLYGVLVLVGFTIWSSLVC